ncbi:MAG: hypothetical protein ABS72_05150 [Paludibacter sp. SCN 50-10]|nr:MAG: hypothetical protein ABS72_05150 [Paludibacter sp. SCN 50-10]
MHRSDHASGLQYFAASNPNLKPVNDALYGWKATTSQTTLTLDGNWYLLDDAAGVKIYPPEAGQTQLTLTFNEGEPLYFTLKPEGYTSVSRPEESEWVVVRNHQNILSVELQDPSVQGVRLTLYSPDGKQLVHTTFASQHQQIVLPGLSPGFYVVRLIASNGKTKTIKLKQ